MSRTTWNFHTAGHLVFGPGSLVQLGELLQKRELKRALIVTDQTLRKIGIVDRCVEPLDAAAIQVHVCDAGAPEPSIEVAKTVIEQAKQFGPDVVIGLGGGSNMDLSKFVASVLTHGGTPQDYFGIDQVPGPVMPIICVPTTSGTGSEVSHAAVLTDTVNEIKLSSMSNFLRPDVALVDPSLTYDCPKQVMADSGIDALTHAIEAMTATDYDRLQIPPGEKSSYDGRFPLGECLAERAVKLVGEHLVAAVTEPGNKMARDGMSLAATLAGMAFSNCGVALVHALEYPIGGAVHCSHGLGNGLLLPYVMKFNQPERIKTFARIALLLGEDVNDLTEEQAADCAVVAVERLKAEIGIPRSLREIGATRDQLPTFAEKTFAIKRLHWINPRQPTYEDLLGILESAF